MATPQPQDEAQFLAEYQALLRRAGREIQEGARPRTATREAAQDAVADDGAVSRSWPHERVSSRRASSLLLSSGGNSPSLFSARQRLSYSDACICSAPGQERQAVGWRHSPPASPPRVQTHVRLLCISLTHLLWECTVQSLWRWWRAHPRGRRGRTRVRRPPSPPARLSPTSSPHWSCATRCAPHHTPVVARRTTLCSPGCGGATAAAVARLAAALASHVAGPLCYFLHMCTVFMCTVFLVCRIRAR